MNDRDIAEYLIAHPDFFERHAELLAGVRLTSPHGQRAVSLQERQIEMQREKTKQIERRLAELMRYGHENDDISAKLHCWTLGLLGERDPHALPEAIARGLRDVFNVPYAAVRLWSVAAPYQPADFARSSSLATKGSRSSRRSAVLVASEMTLSGLRRSWLTMPISCCSSSARRSASAWARTCSVTSVMKPSKCSREPASLKTPKPSR